MKANKYILYFVLSTFGLFLASCEPSEPAKEVLFISEAQAEELIADGELYTLNDFMHIRRSLSNRSLTVSSRTCVYPLIWVLPVVCSRWVRRS